MIDYVKIAIQREPVAKSASPNHVFADGFSFKKRTENTTVSTMLNLSMGTTTLTCPC